MKRRSSPGSSRRSRRARDCPGAIALPAEVVHESQFGSRKAVASAPVRRPMHTRCLRYGACTACVRRVHAKSARGVRGTRGGPRCSHDPTKSNAFNFVSSYFEREKNSYIKSRGQVA